MNSKIYLFLIFITLFLYTEAPAQYPVLFRDARQKDSVKERPAPIIIRSREVLVDVSLLKDPRTIAVTIPLFNQETIRIVRDNLRTERKDRLIWTGTIVGQPYSNVTLVIVGSIVAGNIITDDGKTYQIRYSGKRIYSLREIDESRVPKGAHKSSFFQNAV